MNSGIYDFTINFYLNFYPSINQHKNSLQNFLQNNTKLYSKQLYFSKPMNTISNLSIVFKCFIKYHFGPLIQF